MPWPWRQIIFLLRPALAPNHLNRRNENKMTEQLLCDDLGFQVYCGTLTKDSVEINITCDKLDKAKPCTDEQVKRLLQPLPAEKLYRLSQRAFHERQLEFKVAAKQITPEAAALFKAIGKTMPVMWQGTDNILVLDQVLIKQPYKQAQLVAGVEDERSDLLLARVQKLLQHHHQQV